MKSRGMWYLSGFKRMGLKYRLMTSVMKLMLLLRLIDDEDAKEYSNLLMNSYLIEQGNKKR